LDVPVTDSSSGPRPFGAPAKHSGPIYANPGSKIYPVIVAVFCCLLLLSNVAASKGIQFGWIITDGGFVLFPLTYVIGDVMAEVYGLKAARNAILLGFTMALLASATFYLVSISPPIPGTEDRSDQFSQILGPIWQILLASVCGYLIGQFLNAYVVVKIKAVTKEKHLWARLIGSTVVGEFADTLIFCSIAASVIGLSTFGQFINYVVVGYVYKCLLEVVLMPITYPVIRWVKKREPTYRPALAIDAAVTS
jgi:queuosine precursor transporter